MNNINDNVSIKKNVLLNTVGMCVYFACQWLISIMVVRLSDFSNAGMYSLALSYTNVFFMLSSYSVKPYQISDLKRKFSNEIYLTTRVITCILSLILCAISLMLTNYSFAESKIILIFMVYKLTESYVDVYHSIEQIEWKLEYVSCSYILRGIGNLALFCVGIYYTQNLFICILFMLLCNMFIIIFFDHRKVKQYNGIKLQFDICQIRSLLHCTTPLLLNALLVTFASAWPRLLLENYHGTESLGIFSSILAPALLIPVAINVCIAPLINLFSRLYQNKKIKKIITILILSLFGFIIIGVGCIALTHIFGEKLLVMFYKEQIKPYSNLIYPLMLFSTATAFTYLLTGMATAIREMRGIIISGIIGTILALCLGKVIETDGMMGAAFTLVFVQTAQIVVLMITLFIKLKQDKKEIDANQKERREGNYL